MTQNFYCSSVRHILLFWVMFLWSIPICAFTVREEAVQTLIHRLDQALSCCSHTPLNCCCEMLFPFYFSECFGISLHTIKVHQDCTNRHLSTFFYLPLASSYAIPQWQPYFHLYTHWVTQTSSLRIISFYSFFSCAPPQYWITGIERGSLSEHWSPSFRTLSTISHETVPIWCH